MQAHLVHALIGDGVAGSHAIRRNVLVDQGAALNHDMTADERELVHEGATTDNGPISYLDLSGQLCRVGHDDMVAHNAVVCHMAIGHDQAVVAHNGLTA